MALEGAKKELALMFPDTDAEKRAVAIKLEEEFKGISGNLPVPVAADLDFEEKQLLPHMTKTGYNVVRAYIVMAPEIDRVEAELRAMEIFARPKFKTALSNMMKEDWVSESGQVMITAANTLHSVIEDQGEDTADRLSAINGVLKMHATLHGTKNHNTQEIGGNLRDVLALAYKEIHGEELGNVVDAIDVTDAIDVERIEGT